MKLWLSRIWHSSELKWMGIIAILFVFIIFGVYLWDSTNNEMNGKPIPNGVTIVYKETEYRGALNILRYEAFDTNGVMYYITADNFKTLQVPQLVGQGLYLLPDGKTVTSIGGN